MLRLVQITLIAPCMIVVLAMPVAAQQGEQRLNTTNPYNNRTTTNTYDRNGNRIDGASGRPRADQAALQSSLTTRSQEMNRRIERLTKSRQESAEKWQAIGAQFDRLKAQDKQARVLASRAASMQTIGAAGSGSWGPSLAAKLNAQGDARRLASEVTDGYRRLLGEVDRLKQEDQRINRAQSELVKDYNQLKADLSAGVVTSGR